MKSALAAMAAAGIAVAASLATGTTAKAAEIAVLSAGAVEPGILAAAEAFTKASGTAVKVRFATAPAILRQVGGGETADVVIAPPAVIEELAKSGKLDGAARAAVGRVGAGVAVRQGAPMPDISTTEALKQSVLAAESLVYNQASTGLYIERLFQRLGIAEALAGKTKRYSNGEQVMNHLIKGAGREIGFAPRTEILLYKDKGLVLVGPLPADIQNYTSYAGVAHAAAANRAGAKAFLDFLQRPDSRKLFADRGIE